MERVGISQRPGGGLHIEGFPDAVKLVKLTGPVAARACDLALHRADLDFASRCLDAINTTNEELIRQALWRSAVVHFFKCFGEGARFALDPKMVYRDDPEGQEVFDYMKSLRNKHFVHDENPFAECVSGAVLNRRNASQKIARILTLSLFAETLDRGNWSNLKLLVSRALDWVSTEYETVCERLTDELAAEDYDALEARDGILPPVPGRVETVAVRRTRT